MGGRFNRWLGRGGSTGGWELFQRVVGRVVSTGGFGGAFNWLINTDSLECLTLAVHN